MRTAARHPMLAAISAAGLLCLSAIAAVSAQQSGTMTAVTGAGPDSTDATAASRDAPGAADTTAVGAQTGGAPPSGIATDVADVAGIADEEVIVRGSRSLRRMRIQVGRARLDFFELYNRLNTDERFDMSCKTEYVLGSRIKQEICMPAHAREAYSIAARLEAQGAGTYDPLPDILATNRQMAAEMAELINSNPELLEAVQRYESMLDDYSDAAREEFGDSP